MTDTLGRIYTAAWTACCCAAVAWAWRDRDGVVLFRAAYWRHLLVPWKAATGLLAAGLLIGLAPYADDPSWDRVDAAFMSLLTFATAPWSVGILYRARRGREPRGHAWVALCALLFVSTWSYDLYLFIRDGRYPDTWLGNLFVGPLLYLGAGVFLNLHWSEARGVHPAFLDPSWPCVGGSVALRRLLLPAAALIAMAACAFLPYLWPFLRGLLR